MWRKQIRAITGRGVELLRSTPRPVAAVHTHGARLPRHERHGRLRRRAARRVGAGNVRHAGGRPPAARHIWAATPIRAVFLPKLIDYWRQGRFPFDRLITTYGFDEIGKAFHDCEAGTVIKPVLEGGARHEPGNPPQAGRVWARTQHGSVRRYHRRCSRALQPPLPDRLQVTRDHEYGPDERQRLDIFAMPRAGEGAGAGLRAGRRLRAWRQALAEGQPFYDNIGGFAARNGMVGVTMNYRLAPTHKWPAGTDDMALAIDWLRANIAHFGGDPERISLSGTSAGAVHVGCYVALREPKIAGAIMISGALRYVEPRP